MKLTNERRFEWFNGFNIHKFEYIISELNTSWISKYTYEFSAPSLFNLFLKNHVFETSFIFASRIQNYHQTESYQERFILIWPRSSTINISVMLMKDHFTLPYFMSNPSCDQWSSLYSSEFQRNVWWFRQLGHALAYRIPVLCI